MSETGRSPSDVCDHDARPHDCTCNCDRLWCRASRREPFETITDTQMIAPASPLTPEETS